MRIGSHSQSSTNSQVTEKQQEDLNLDGDMEESRRVTSHYVPTDKIIPQHSGYGFL